MYSFCLVGNFADIALVSPALALTAGCVPSPTFHLPSRQPKGEEREREMVGGKEERKKKRNYACAVVRMLPLKHCRIVAFTIVNLFLTIEAKGYINSQILSKATAQVYQLKNSSLLHNVPRSIDYRNKYVTQVKNQGACGACWALVQSKR